jgi:hypothetical protein
LDALANGLKDERDDHEKQGRRRRLPRGFDRFLNARW